MSFTFTTTQPGASADYGKYITDKPQKTDRYQDPTLLEFALAPIDSSFVKLTRGAYITLSTTKYPNWFTGWVTNDPDLTFLGSKGGVAVWGYKYYAASDEYILNLKPLSVPVPFMNVSMGTIIKTLADSLEPGIFDFTNIDDGPVVAQYAIGNVSRHATAKFLDVTQDLTTAASYSFWSKNMKLYFKPQNDTALGGVVLDGNDTNFTPSQLQIQADPTPIVNDVIVEGQLEPQAYCHEYFVSTGLSDSLPLMTGVFGSDTNVLINEDFGNSSIDTTVWNVYDDPTNFIQVANGFLNSIGGRNDGSFYAGITSVSPIPMDAKLRLTHGEWDFVSQGLGVICSLWTGATNGSYSGCLYGLQSQCTDPGPGITYQGQANSLVGTLIPIVNGALDSTQSVATYSTMRYIIRTLVSFNLSNRSTQVYSYIDATGAVNAIAAPGGNADTALWQTIITEVNPAFGNVTNQWTFTNTAHLDGVHDLFANYVPLASDSLHATVTGITVSIPINGSLETSQDVILLNPSFENWSDSVTPVDWEVFYTGTVNQETVFSNTGSSCKLTANSAGAAQISQGISNLLSPTGTYTVAIHAQRAISTTSGILQVFLSSASWVISPAININVSSLDTDYGILYGQLNTVALGPIPGDAQLMITWSEATPGDQIWVDDIVMYSNYTQQYLGPNEIDSIDGMAPMATVVSTNNGAYTNSTYLGIPQYNPGQDQLVFFKDSVTLISSVPPKNQIIRLSYRASGPAVGRANSRASINQEAVNWGDNGLRTVVRGDLLPRPRTALECEMAAASLVGEGSFTHYTGTYTQWSDYFSKEPQGGGILTFLNLNSMAPNLQAEEISQVQTTIMSTDDSVERFSHVISFGRPDRIRTLLSKFDDPTGVFVPTSSYTPPPAVDIAAVGLSFAPDVTNPYLVGWDENYVYIDAGQDLPTGSLYFEVRYTDDSWGVDDAKNLIARSATRSFKVPRTVVGRVFFVKLVMEGNLLPWSEDQTINTVYTQSAVFLNKAQGIDPDQNRALLCSGTTGSGSTLIAGFTALGANKHCFSCSIKGIRGNTVTLITSVGGVLPLTFTLSGQWQRFSLPLTGVLTGLESVGVRFNETGTFSTTQWAVEQNTLTETFYSKTTANLYGLNSRYSAAIHVAFPASDTLDGIDGSGLLLIPTY